MVLGSASVSQQSTFRIVDQMPVLAVVLFSSSRYCYCSYHSHLFETVRKVYFKLIPLEDTVLSLHMRSSDQNPSCIVRKCR